MNIILDACAIINLANSGLLVRLGELKNCHFWVGPIVLGECSSETAATAFEMIASEQLSKLTESEISAERYFELLDDFELGPGETECLVAAEQFGFSVCTDDSLARRASEEMFGAVRRMGSARLLKWFVEADLLRCIEASYSFQRMKDEGGYLPDLPEDFFCAR